MEFWDVPNLSNAIYRPIICVLKPTMNVDAAKEEGDSILLSLFLLVLFQRLSYERHPCPVRLRHGRPPVALDVLSPEARHPHVKATL